MVGSRDIEGCGLLISGNLAKCWTSARRQRQWGESEAMPPPLYLAPGDVAHKYKCDINLVNIPSKC